MRSKREDRKMIESSCVYIYSCRMIYERENFKPLSSWLDACESDVATHARAPKTSRNDLRMFAVSPSDNIRFAVCFSRNLRHIFSVLRHVQEMISEIYQIKQLQLRNWQAFPFVMRLRFFTYVAKTYSNFRIFSVALWAKITLCGKKYFMWQKRRYFKLQLSSTSDNDHQRKKSTAADFHWIEHSMIQFINRQQSATRIL